MRVVLARDKQGSPEGRVYFRGEITLVEGNSGEVTAVPGVTYFAEEAFVFASQPQAEQWAYRLVDPVFLLSKPAFQPVVLAQKVSADVAVPGFLRRPSSSDNTPDDTDGGEAA